MTLVPPGIAYISFDAVPSPKGASTHIQAFVQALAAQFGSIDLVTIGASLTAAPPVERWPGVLHYELPAMGKSLIDRVLCFRLFLERWLAGRSYEIVHFRSIFEGLPLLSLRPRPRLIFEVNGLPSIELKYRYPGVVDDRELMRKLIAQEAACLDAADLIVTPSAVTRDYLASARGVDPGKIRVIPNGVDIDLFHPAQGTTREDPMRLIYFGTLSAWQGVELAIRALAQTTATLTIVGSGSGRQRDALMSLAAKLNLAHRVTILPPMPQLELANHLRKSDAVLVPLTLSDRNTLQGCCPLKALEGMASGTPVIATDLPVVREFGRDGEHFLLVRPGSVDHLAETILRLASDPDLAARLGSQARRHTEAHYTWRQAGDELIACYRELPVLLRDPAVPART
jgi:glycosyltransferase involved in cell wall biosynthesis